MNDATLPNGWAIATLGDVADETVDRCGPAGSEFIYVDISSIDREKKFISDAKVIESASAPSRAKQVLQGGDVLISMTRPNLNAIAMVTTEFHGSIGSTGFHVLRSKWVEPKFLFYLVHTREFIEQMCLCVQGALYPAVRPNDIASFSFSLPSRTEQHRIVAKIEELFSELDKGIENLKTAQAQLKVYRQALLKHAFEGKLTAQWREQRAVTPAKAGVQPLNDMDSRLRGNDEPLETADALQKRIQQERAQRYQQQIADWQTNGGSKPKAPKPLPQLSAEELAELPELPEGWGWCKWEDILVSEKGAFKRGPFGSALKKEFFVKSGYKVYEQYCPINDDCSFERYYISDEKFRELESFSVRADDFLVSCSGVTLGRITQVPLNFKEGIINQALLRVRVNSAVYDFQFFKTFFRSRYFQKRIFENSTGTAIPNVKGVNELKAIPLPLCSLLEQQQIILELEARLSEVDQLELTLTTSLQQSEALRQSILKKAYAGQLVPQDPHDEPASALLARIRAERAVGAKNAPTAAKPRKSRTSSI